MAHTPSIAASVCPVLCNAPVECAARRATPSVMLTADVPAGRTARPTPRFSRIPSSQIQARAGKFFPRTRRRVTRVVKRRRIVLMDVVLKPELEKLVTEKVECGEYATAAAVIEEALQLLGERDRLKARAS